MTDTYRAGRDLQVGDTIEVWWQPGRDTIIGLWPYVGSLTHLFPQGAQTAAFALSNTGMTIDNGEMYRLINTHAHARKAGVGE